MTPELAGALGWDQPHEPECRCPRCKPKPSLADELREIAAELDKTAYSLNTTGLDYTIKWLRDLAEKVEAQAGDVQ